MQRSSTSILKWYNYFNGYSAWTFFLCLVIFISVNVVYMVFPPQIFYGRDWLTVEQIFGAQAKWIGDTLYELFAGFIAKIIIGIPFRFIYKWVFILIHLVMYYSTMVPMAKLFYFILFSDIFDHHPMSGFRINEFSLLGIWWTLRDCLYV